MKTESHRISVRRLSILTLLGFSSGLPLSLTGGTLQAWFTQAGIDVKTIGLLSLVGIPYALKFLWAPLLDRYAISSLGRRRSWMLVSQCFITLGICILAILAPAEQHLAMASIALVIAFFSATQDIAVDAYRTELLKAHERGVGVGLAVAAYRLALIFAGAGALFLASSYGFSNAYLVMAAAMAVGISASLFGTEPMVSQRTINFSESFWQPLKDILVRKQWLLLLALVVSYKLGDAFAEKLAMTFLLRELEFSLNEVGALYQSVGITSAVIGGLLGGVLMLRLSLFKALFVFGLLQMLTNIGFVLLAIWGKSYALMVAVVISENVFGGMGTAAFIALIMALCNVRFTASQFALFTAFASLGRVFSGPAAGAIVKNYGWVDFFSFTVFVGLMPLVLLSILKPTIIKLEQSIDEEDVHAVD